MILSGNTIMITGGSSGIGLAMAKKFAALQNKVIITGRNKSKLDAIQKDFPEFICLQADLANKNAMDELVLEIEQKYPETNVLINNAAVQYNYSFLEEQDLTYKIDYEIATNLIGPIRLTALLLPTLLKNESSAIVNVSSGLFIAPKMSASVYCATKSAIHSHTKTLRYQLERSSIKVFEIIPALVETPMTEGRGKSKISPEQLVDEFMKDFQRDKPESYIGKTKLLKAIGRLAPKLADRIMKNGL
ncbi:SDR family oxidoreductase [Jiulongibacter sediminis]|uniref:Oxidoreductase n=1 Tax=Jiulongibacter sediminis TaxID=1605367 RepID=A0A0P7C5V3_9BACT|nr:SDR family NAD(P)-dependent oxidoreductase [Jiulongibacter sediminis]KPM48711.1 oxidoreductase [Jiulongibacter sediminis]TBX25247.1 oxidoreductase [Jiulongibacter sediminis]